MVAAGQRPKLLAIVGPTASGKSAWALDVASKYEGEIICADSRTIYSGMDIGTAKPSNKEQARVPHWGLDLVEPGQRYNVHQFKTYAEAKIKNIQGRGKLPILAGGTGLYIDAVLFDYKFQQGTKSEMLPGTLIVGIMPPAEVIRQRINQRVEQMFKDGFIKEVRQLYEKFGDKLELTAGIGYKPGLRLIKGEISESQAKEEFKKQDWQYARRQRTWFRRNPHIKWFETSQRALNFISKSFL